MSQDQLNALLAKLNEETSLRERLQSAADINEVVTIAKEHGYTIDADDVMKYQNDQSADLSDAELEKVAGGAGGGCYADAQTVPSTMYATKNCYGPG
jgi:predicted ribosomally synthesized peptide with nif11-like leader